MEGTLSNAYQNMINSSSRLNIELWKSHSNFWFTAHDCVISVIYVDFNSFLMAAPWHSNYKTDV